MKRAIICVIIMAAIIAIGLWADYVIATSSLPDWMKFALLQR